MVTGQVTTLAMRAEQGLLRACRNLLRGLQAASTFWLASVATLRYSSHSFIDAAHVFGINSVLVSPQVMRQFSSPGLEKCFSGTEWAIARQGRSVVGALEAKNAARRRFRGEDDSSAGCR